ncbi:MAG: hypothetical protein ACOH1T_12860, partial [Microbacteriaceae bacterium]
MMSPAATVTDVLVLFPAASVAVPLTVVPGGTVTELVDDPPARQLVMPETDPLEPGSSHVKETVVVPSGFFVSAAEMVGAILSMRTVTEPLPTLPSRSVAVAWRTTMPLAVSM